MLDTHAVGGRVYAGSVTSRKRPDDRKALTATATALSVAAGKAATVAGATFVGVVGAALVAAVGPTVGFLWQTTTDWHVRQTEKWWDALSAKLGPGVSHEVEDRVMHERVTGQEPVAGKVIAASVRTLLEGLDDALVPALAALAAEYLRERKPADDFFRAVARTLADLDKVGLTDLRSVAEHCVGFTSPGVELESVLREKDQWVLVQAREEDEHRAPNARRSPPFVLNGGVKLITLMKRHGMGWEAPSRMDQVNPFRCFLDLADMERVRRIAG
jgi:hypothetical protein